MPSSNAGVGVGAGIDSVRCCRTYVADPALCRSCARFLLTLAEVSVALTAFSGIAVVVGRRSVGRWTRSDVVRFTTMLVNGVMAVLFCLMPFLCFDPGVSSLESDWKTLLIIVGVAGLFEVQWRVRIAWVAIRNHVDEDSNLLSHGPCIK